MLTQRVIFRLINNLLRVLDSALYQALMKQKVGCYRLHQGDGLVALDGLGKGFVLLN